MFDRQPDPSADDSRWVRESQQGNLSAFNLLVERYQQQVYNVALALLRDQPLAEDATQEAFLAAWRGVRGYRGGSFRGWLLRIATNACYDMLRRQRRRPATSLDALRERTPGADGLAPDPNPGPEDVALHHEFSLEIRRALDRLPEDQRLVVILSDVQGLSYEEVAEVVRAPVGTVKSRLSRARGTLRIYLRQMELLPAAARPHQ